MERKRINLSVTEAIYNELTEVAASFGHSSAAPLCSAVLAGFIDCCNRPRKPEPEPTDAEYIREMFNSLVMDESSIRDAQAQGLAELSDSATYSSYMRE